MIVTRKMPFASNSSRRLLPNEAAPYLQAAPLALVLGAYLLLPLCAILVVSFWTYNGVQPAPGFVLDNYLELVKSTAVWLTFLNTFKFAGVTWAITLVLGFALAYFFVFFIRSTAWRLGLLLFCTIPFWTSNIIRMIAWVPLLGREGLVNYIFVHLGLLARPLDGLLYSDFAVIVAYVQLYTLFMIAPIMNSMVRIDGSLIEAAIDAGASQWRIIWDIVAPLSRSGIAVGSVLILTLVMGDFITVRVMSGGQSPAVGLMIFQQVGLVQYPDAAAAAILLLAAVLLVVAALLRMVNIRREL